MLTLRPAFGQSSRTRLLRQISEAEPEPLRTGNPCAPRDLVTIVAKAMARELSDQTAGGSAYSVERAAVCNELFRFARARSVPGVWTEGFVRALDTGRRRKPNR